LFIVTHWFIKMSNQQQRSQQNQGRPDRTFQQRILDGDMTMEDMFIPGEHGQYTEEQTRRYEDYRRRAWFRQRILDGDIDMEEVGVTLEQMGNLVFSFESMHNMRNRLGRDRSTPPPEYAPPSRAFVAHWHAQMVADAEAIMGEPGVGLEHEQEQEPQPEPESSSSDDSDREHHLTVEAGFRVRGNNNVYGSAPSDMTRISEVVARVFSDANARFENGTARPRRRRLNITINGGVDIAGSNNVIGPGVNMVAAQRLAEQRRGAGGAQPGTTRPRATPSGPHGNTRQTTPTSRAAAGSGALVPTGPTGHTRQLVPFGHTSAPSIAAPTGTINNNNNRMRPASQYFGGAELSAMHQPNCQYNTARRIGNGGAGASNAGNNNAQAGGAMPDSSASNGNDDDLLDQFFDFN
jgi:hypothetical protein